MVAGIRQFSRNTESGNGCWHSTVRCYDMAVRRRLFVKNRCSTKRLKVGSRKQRSMDHLSGVIYHVGLIIQYGLC